MGPLKLLLGLFLLPRSFWDAFRLLRQFRPDVVVGVGGYSSGPVVLTAWLMGLPTAIQEQNALPGFTNRVLGRFVDAVFIAFDAARAPFNPKKVHLLGNPIRKTLLENFLRPKIPHEKFAVLVFGGSLGARGLNARVVDALDHLADVKDQLAITHQTGKADLAMVTDAYKAKGWNADVREFIDDMSSAYLRSDLVLCRAGATTLAELTVCKKAAVLVPFPFATDDHQAVNAKALVDAGAAVMFREAELTGQKVAETVKKLMVEPAQLAVMEKAAGNLGRPEAAREIADVLMELTFKKWGQKGRERSGPSLRPEKKATEKVS
jgi:UDP-N-acetylglucosamine--N-acetylmuramyl-(pentapeptide) pyrophosphoryl-undecaprenol N-acetylglucosamine transferase